MITWLRAFRWNIMVAEVSGRGGCSHSGKQEEEWRNNSQHGRQEVDWRSVQHSGQETVEERTT